MARKTTIETFVRNSDEGDNDDTGAYYVVRATCGDTSGEGRSYSQDYAEKTAIENLHRNLALTPVSPGWENTVESFLCRN